VEEVIIHHENGSYYKGPLVNGLYNGRGYFHDSMANMTFVGYYLDGMKHGTGSYTSDSQHNSSPDYIYDGEWSYDKREGHGQLITKHIKYSGNFKNDKYHGYGVYCDQDSTVYCGDWERGMKHGTGQITFKNGNSFTGDFIKDKENGNG
jgi:hypothetical protein